MIGTQIINYKLTREIGSGGMATVFEAVHTRLDTKVAIKILDPVLAANESIRERFVQEAKIMASLNHEGITRVSDFDDSGNHLAIIMEFLEGQTLDEYVQQNGALDENNAKSIFVSVLKAFEYAHGKGIVHRDIKPSNIFITKRGDVKIMDFGIAKLVEEGAKVLTQTGTQMGTPVYMSPEQVNDSKHIDQRTDIYSLAVTLWFMLKGQPPYNVSEESTFQILKKVDSENLPTLPQHQFLNTIITRATEKDPKKRYNSCKAFEEAILTEDLSLEPTHQEATIIIADTQENIKLEDTPAKEIKKEEPIKVASDKKEKKGVIQAWGEIADSENTDDFIAFRKDYPYSQFDKKAKRIMLFLELKKIQPVKATQKAIRSILFIALIPILYFCTPVVWFFYENGFHHGFYSIILLLILAYFISGFIILFLKVDKIKEKKEVGLLTTLSIYICSAIIVFWISNFLVTSVIWGFYYSYLGLSLPLLAIIIVSILILIAIIIIAIKNNFFKIPGLRKQINQL